MPAGSQIRCQRRPPETQQRPNQLDFNAIANRPATRHPGEPAKPRPTHNAVKNGLRLIVRMMPHRHDDGCFYENAEVFSEAVAYEEEAMRKLLDSNDLCVTYQEGGTWTGHHGLGYQDIVIAQREDGVGP